MRSSKDIRPISRVEVALWMASDWCWDSIFPTPAHLDFSSRNAPIACCRLVRRWPLHLAAHQAAKCRSASSNGACSVGNGKEARSQAEAKCWSGSRPNGRSGGNAALWDKAPACWPSAWRWTSRTEGGAKTGLKGPSQLPQTSARHSWNSTNGDELRRSSTSGNLNPSNHAAGNSFWKAKTTDSWGNHCVGTVTDETLLESRAAMTWVVRGRRRREFVGSCSRGGVVASKTIPAKRSASQRSESGQSHTRVRPWSSWSWSHWKVRIWCT